MCTCYNGIRLTVIDRGKPVEIYANIEDVERFSRLSVIENGWDSDKRNLVDAMHDKDVLSDEAVDQVVEHVQRLAAARMLPCHCSGGGENIYCACRDLRPDFLHPRKGPLNEL